MAVWRNRHGKIVCPGDNCPQECDESCPIWLNTLGLMNLQTENYEQAIDKFKKSISIADDFIDAYNNLGVAYGMSDQHKSAYEAYKKAHDLDANYPKALYGLILSEINLKMFGEASKHCDEYDKLPECDSSELRKNLYMALQKPSDDYTCLTDDLLDIGRLNGFISSESAPFIPEILTQCSEVYVKIFRAINEFAKTHTVSNVMSLTYMWSAFTGMGAVYHWHYDWGTLSREGIFETLTKERGIDEMDEYVLDIIGINHQSSEGKEIFCLIKELADYCLENIIKSNAETTPDRVLDGAKAMFTFGMVFEMNRLGMR